MAVIIIDNKFIKAGNNSMWYTTINEVRTLIIDDLLEGKPVSFVYDQTLIGH